MIETSCVRLKTKLGTCYDLHNRFNIQSTMALVLHFSGGVK